MRPGAAGAGARRGGLRLGRIRELAGRLWREHASPGRLGLAVALGVVVGCTPLFGVHFWIGLGLALALRLNKVAVFLGSQISIPPLAPFVGFASVQIGALLLRGETLDLTYDDFALARLPDVLGAFFTSWLLGGLLLGTAVGAPLGLVTAAIVRRRRRRATPEQAARRARELERERSWRQTLERATALYRAAPRRGHRHYARIKYTMDPLYRQIAELLGAPDGPRTVVDLGTGLGMLPVLLALRGQADRIVGVDWDGAKIDSGTRAAAQLPAVELRRGDIRECELPRADVVVLADVLHYWPLATQGQLLERAVAALAPRGELVIRDTDRRGRSWLTRLLEGIAVKVGWNRGPGLCYRTSDGLRRQLEELGLDCPADAAPSESAVHGGNFLIAAKKVVPPDRCS